MLRRCVRGGSLTVRWFAPNVRGYALEIFHKKLLEYALPLSSSLSSVDEVRRRFAMWKCWDVRISCLFWVLSLYPSGSFRAVVGVCWSTSRNNPMQTGLDPWVLLLLCYAMLTSATSYLMLSTALLPVLPQSNYRRPQGTFDYPESHSAVVSNSSQPNISCTHPRIQPRYTCTPYGVPRSILATSAMDYARSFDQRVK